MKKDGVYDYMFLRYTYNNKIYLESGHLVKDGDEYIISFYGKIYMNKGDTLDIKLCAKDIKYSDIIESHTNSSIEIYYVDYLE